jgi:hypothetical protein
MRGIGSGILVVRLPEAGAGRRPLMSFVPIVVTMIGAPLVTLSRAGYGDSGWYAWLGVCLLELAGMFAVREILQRQRQREQARTTWMRGLREVEDRRTRAALAVECLTGQLGLDRWQFRSARFERMTRAAREMDEELPWLWIDLEILPLLRSGAIRNAAGCRVNRGSIGTMAVALPVLAVVSIGVPLIVGLLLQDAGHDPNPARAWVIAMAAIWTVIGIGCLRRPRPRLVIANQALGIWRGEKCYGEPAPGTSYIVVTKKFDDAGAPTDTPRWWFLLPGRPAMFVDDLHPEATPWSDEIFKAAMEFDPDRLPPLMCGFCSHPTLGLRDPICPECGEPLQGRSSNQTA